MTRLMAAALAATIVISCLDAAADDSPPSEVEPTEEDVPYLEQIALFPFEVSEFISVEQAEFLTTQVFKTFEARLGESYNIVKVEIRTGDAGSIYRYSDSCDRACMLRKSTEAGMSYAVTTETQRFGDGIAVTLELVETDSGRVVESASGGCDGSATELIGEVNELVDKLIAALERIADAESNIKTHKPEEGAKFVYLGAPPKPGATKVAAGWVMFGLFDIGGGVFFGLYREDERLGYLMGTLGCSLVSLIGLIMAISGHVDNAYARDEWDRKHGASVVASRRPSLSVAPLLLVTQNGASLGLGATF